MFYKLLATLSSMDRCHSGPEMESAYKALIDFYKGARLLVYKSNDEVNHWRKPPYWVCNHAELKDDAGTIIASYDKHKLSLYTYSPSIDETISLDQLQNHLFSDPNRPESICFYFRNQYRHWDVKWGFSIPHKIRESLDEKVMYQVTIDSKFDFSRPMVQSDYCHEGESDYTYIFVGHFDHPAQVNDGIAGCIVAYEIIKRLQGRKTRFSYRAFASVEIVGSVYYLDSVEGNVKKIKEAIFLALSGIESPLAYQQSYKKSSLLDRIVIFLMKFYSGDKDNIFLHRELIGNDENIFDSVGYEIPCGTLTRWPFPEYHTDSDNMDITSRSSLEDVIEFGLRVINIIEKNFYFSTKKPGVPCLSNPKIDLYLSPDAISGTKSNSKSEIGRFSCELPKHEQKYLRENTHLLNQLMQDFLRLSDGKHTILDVAEKSSIPFDFVFMYATLLKDKGIIEFYNTSK